MKEEAGDLEGAFNLLTKAAELGNTSAQVNLGNFYAAGKGVEKSLDKAAEWYKAAFRKGDPGGAHNLAIDLKNQGRIKEAIFWFKRAIALNHGDTIIELAKLLRTQPSGTPMAIRYLKRAIKLAPDGITAVGREEARHLLRRIEITVHSARVRRKAPRKRKSA